MNRLKLEVSRLSVLIISLFIGFGFMTYSVQAAKQPTNAQELLNLVTSTNVGWDWVPRCADGAYWSTKLNDCKGGTGHERIDSNNYGSSSYNLTSAQELISKATTINRGWDWRPRCANGAHWNWSDMVCKGGI